MGCEEGSEGFCFGTLVPEVFFTFGMVVPEVSTSGFFFLACGFFTFSARKSVAK
jgi:hypothetical protein